MTFKLTERDKKLLVFLAFFVLIVGVGVGVLYPLFSASQSTEEKLAAAEVTKVEYENKATTASSLEGAQEEVKAELAAAQKQFYKVMPSTKIDKLLTEMAVKRGVTVTNLDITMPERGIYTALPEYGAQSMAMGTASKDANVANGIYTASVRITMSGSRAQLQKILDEWASLEPKLRVAEFLWQTNTKQGYTLAASLELYMADTIEQYQQEQAELAAAAAASAAAQNGN